MLETIAIVFSFISAWQAKQQNIYTWLSGMIGIIAYFIIFKNDKNYANTMLQIIFAIQSIYGFFCWKKVDNATALSTFSTILKQIICVILISIICYITNTIFKGELSLLDATTTGLSIVATILLAHKKTINWFYWILADILYICLFINSNHIGSAILYVLFLIMAVMALFEWSKKN
jgi:nicotinamide mononucleotide transporter